MTNNIFVPQTFNGERMVNVNTNNRRQPSEIPMPPSTNQRPRIAPNPAPQVNGNNTMEKKVVSPTPPPFTPQQQQEEETVQKYWSEANIAILIQLHRKYFATEETRHNPDNWNQLTKEYNTITSDSRPKKSIMDRWDKLMRKYNAERSCMANQHTTSMPIVSYWNHFQYMDSYLGHLPIPDDILYKHTHEDDYDDVVIHKRKRTSEPESQIDLIKKHYDAMAHMNMKFIDMCEKITTQQHNNENRYLNLLEKYMSLKDKNIPDNNV